MQSPIAQSFLTTLVAYGSLLVGAWVWPTNPSVSLGAKAVFAPVALLLLPLFTLTHAVLPVFCYSQFFDRGRELPGCARAFLYFHMGIWYGVPLAGASVLTGGFGLLGIATHIALCPKGSRTWRFLQYGSTSFSLFLLMSIAGHWWWMFFAAFLIQCALLTILEYKAKNLWVRNSNGHSSQSRNVT